MNNIKNYHGREQSYIKHQFLTHYLQSAAYKIFLGRSQTFNFVDGFAGPWRINDKKDYSDASFEQARRTLEEVRIRLEQRKPGLKVRFCFCEKRKSAYDQLREYAQSHESFEIRVFHGLFEEHLNDISDVCKDGFTFTFIDPTGWDIRSEPILEFLRKQNGEFLLNFMAEPIHRHARYEGVSDSFGRFLADPKWENQFNALSLNQGTEERVLFLLKEKIRKTGAARYVPDFPIANPSKNRVKMRLLLGTHSSKGLEVFRNVQKKVEQQAIRLRNENQQQISLFTADEIVALEQKRAGIDCPKFCNKAEERIIKHLQAGKKTFEYIAIDVLEHVQMRRTRIKDLVKDMKSNNIIHYDLPSRRKKPQDDTMLSLVQSPPSLPIS